ncbi:MAG TPA: DUF4388 domain-containing protein, partial [Vicinamibacteria bacterium]|nr:DUF4388 domain-containing protein [Vicinamibacteria bacterium]
HLKGQIYLHDGKIVHAQLEDAVGEEAVYTLAIWSQGDFKFEPGIATDERTITKSNTNLLMEAARRLDEWRVLSKKIPSTEMVPEFVVQDSREGQINLNTSEWLILSKVDGHRTVKEIAHASGLSVFDAAKMLYGLITTNLIRLREPPTARPAVPAAAAPAPAPSPIPGPPGGTTPLPGAQAAGVPAPGATPPPPHVAPLLSKLGRIREECVAVLGPVGETVVNKHYQKARAEIERGAGAEALEDAVQQIARAASILKGPSASDAILEQLRGLR